MALQDFIKGQSLPAQEKGNAWLEKASNAIAPQEAMQAISARVDKWRQEHGLASRDEIANWLENKSAKPEIAPINVVTEEPWHESNPQFAPTPQVKAVPDDFLPRPKMVNKKTLRDFFNDSWVDEAGNTWQVRFQNINGSVADGAIICNNVEVGSWARRVNLEQDTVNHLFLKLSPRMQGKGFARTWLERSAQRYEAWGLDTITLDTGWDGAATWPKMGFDIAYADDLDDDGAKAAYVDSSYATAMKEALHDGISNLELLAGKVSEENLQKIEVMLIQMQKNPPRLPDLVKNEPQLAKIILRNADFELHASTKDILEIAHQRHQAISF